jgi:DNA polymerase III gamma/tau subunit
LLDLQKEFNNKSLYDTKRVYIIKNAEKLNSASANTILKFLEEPENDIIALLLTDNRYHVIDTIISRCQILTLKEDIFVFDDNEDIINLLECIIKPRDFFIRYNYFINNVILDKDSAFNKFSTIENLLTQYLNHYYCTNEINNDISNILDKVDKNRILNTISILEDSLKKLEFNVNYKLWIDSLISRLVLGG